MELDGKVAIVTGGGSGIGRASATALAASGAAVVVADIDEVGAAGTVAHIHDGGGTAVAHTTDVTDVDACGELVARAVDTYGGLHVLHNNAGIALPLRGDGATADIDPAAWDRVIATNLSSVFYCSHHAVKHMGPGGSIINTASSMSTLPLGELDAYAAAKGGVALLTRSMAANCGRLGIRVNAIAPGYVDTPMNEMIWGTPELKDAFAGAHATGLQDVDEIADVVVFLASDASRALTGAVVTCDRGWTAFKRPF